MYKFLLILFYLLNISLAWSKYSYTCAPSSLCKHIDKEIRSLEEESTSLGDFESKLRQFPGISEIQSTQERLIFNFYPPVDVISIKHPYESELEDVLDVIPVKTGKELNLDTLEQSCIALERIDQTKGYANAKCNYVLRHEDGKIVLEFNLNIGPKWILRKINISGKLDNEMDFYLRPLIAKEGEVWNRTEIVNLITQVEGQIIKAGYFNSRLSYQINDSVNEVILDLNLQKGKRYFVGFYGNNIISNNELKTTLTTKIKEFNYTIDARIIETITREKYKSIGHYHPVIESREVANNKDEVTYFIEINEGKKTNINSLLITGVNETDYSDLSDIFYREGSELIRSGDYDESYVNNYSERIRRYFIEKGFLQTKVSRPDTDFTSNGEKVDINILVEKGVQTVVQSLRINGIGEKFQSEIKERLSTKVNQPFNPLILDSDIKQVLDALRNKGFIDVKLVNNKPKEIVFYSDNFEKVNIIANIYLGEKHIFDSIKVDGLNKTQIKVIERSVHLELGQIITPTDLQKIKDRLQNLGIFSEIRVSSIISVIDRKKHDLLIEVREKEFGLIEVAPGFRTDLGLKLSSSISYNNINGSARTLSFGTTLNQRFNNDALNRNRPEANAKKPEYQLRLNFYEPFLFNLPASFQATGSYTDKRYFNFDAEIVKAETIVGKEITDSVFGSFGYQLEGIKQENAYIDVDNGYFNVGSLVSGLTLDYRDSLTNPRKGGLFNLNLEYADPSLLSDNDPGQRFEFFKIFTQNNIYLPLYDHVLAIRLAGGVQKNLSNKLLPSGKREGYIPKTKVFRLSGFDNVRGFSDSEINLVKLNNGSEVDISDIEVDDMAYYFNLKLEPRYYFSDQLALGVFYDAGSLYLNCFCLNSLRSSVGLSFKYLTPVGSLDFEYGVKLHRRREASGSLESPGRLHISIGIF